MISSKKGMLVIVIAGMGLFLTAAISPKKAGEKKEKVLKEEYADGAYTVLCETGKTLKALSRLCDELAQMHGEVLEEMRSFIEQDGALTRKELQASIKKFDETAADLYELRARMDSHAARGHQRRCIETTQPVSSK